MRNVVFKRGSDGNFFEYEDEGGSTSCFQYVPSVENLWENINENGFIVELLINPVFDKESNIYSLRSRDRSETIGYVFPITVLDSENDVSEYRNLNSYVFAAYMILLKRIPRIKQCGDSFTKEFEDNIHVIVFHKKTVKIDNPLHLCIHSLREYGYSYFMENNTYVKTTGYTDEVYLGNKKEFLELAFCEPSLYKCPSITELLQSLPTASDVTHRFVLLYQVIEILMDEIKGKEIDAAIQRFHENGIHNDFLDDLRGVSSEKTRINIIFESLNQQSPVCKEFMNAVEQLFDLINYQPKDKSISALFYSFRNQMTHSYRNLHKFRDKLAYTIQQFERIVMLIIERYP